MAGKIIVARCPGVVSDRKSEGFGKRMDGCWVCLNVNGVRFYMDGTIFCPHCGSRAETDSKTPWIAPDEVIPIEVSLTRIDPANLVARADDMMCCYNDDCSKRYLPQDAKGSDAVYADQSHHSGTQYVWAKDDEGEDTWAFGEDRDAEGYGLEPRAENEGRSWRRCIFCGALMKAITVSARKRTIARSSAEDEQSRQWWGPAATFRIVRLKAAVDSKEKTPSLSGKK